MKILASSMALVAALSCSSVLAAEKTDPLCKPLQAFVASVAPHQTHAFEFHALWGGAFKNAPEAERDTLASKQCDHHGYAPAKSVCRALMEFGVVEFSSSNAERVLSCLSPGTRFAPHVTFVRGEFELRYGTDKRGGRVTVLFRGDEDMGGTVLRVAADGY